MTEENVTTDQEISPSTHRVKLYQLNIDTNWEDKGTGFCTYQLGIDRQPDQIIVHSEEDNSVLLISNVLKRRLYQRQQETLIVWTEDDNRDLALSFENSGGCEEIWKCIGKKQDGGGSMIAGDPVNADYIPPEVISLPDPELNNLIEITETLNAARTLQEKDKISAFISNEHYIDKLMPLFETCEDLEDIADLNLLYTVMIAILTLNDQGLIELLVRDEYIFNFMGILEYNPKTPGMKAKHREFIKTRGNVKQVVRLTDESITRRIDHTFRLEYLQAILLNTESDEGLMGVMNNLIFQYHVEIVNYFQNNHVLLTELFDQIKTATTESRHGIIRFVHQLCQLTKQMQNSARVSLFRSLASYGLFDLMCFALEEDDRMMRTNSLNILASFTNLDVASVRSHIMIQSRDEAKELKPLLEVIVEQFASDADYDLKVQYFEILRLLLDPTGNTPIVGPGANDPASKMNPETDEFLQIFYDKYVSTLLNPIERLDIKPISLKGPIELLHLTQDQAQLCLYLCEFLCFAVRNHGYRSKYILLSSNLFLKVAQLYRSKYAYIKLGALRFFRVCVSKTDEFFNQNLLKHNILEPTIRVLLDTDGRDCLLNSACLDFFDHIRQENIKSLVNRSISQFGTVLDTITYISTFSQLRVKFDQNMDGEESTTNAAEDSSLNDNSDKKVNHDGWTSSTVDDDEEEYFNGSDEEDTAAAPQIPPTKATSITPLVDYHDDDDEEEEEENNPVQQEEGSLKRKKEKEETVSPRPVKSRKATDEESEKPIEAEASLEQESPRSVRTRRTLEEEEDDDDESLKDESTTPPPFKSRKVTDDEDEDDVLAKKSPRQSPLTKKIVIKTSTNIKKMRSTLH